MQFLLTFVDEVLASSSLVWSVAILLSAISAYVLHTYIGDWLYSSIISVAMFVSVLIGNAGFARLGLLFTADSDANIVAAAGFSICALTVMAVILMRVFNAIGDLRQKMHYQDEPNV